MIVGDITIFDWAHGRIRACDQQGRKGERPSAGAPQRSGGNSAEEQAADAARSAYHDLGPGLPSRVTVHVQARELLALAQRAVEFSGRGQTADLSLALAQLEAMRAVLGDGGDGDV